MIVLSYKLRRYLLVLAVFFGVLSGAVVSAQAAFIPVEDIRPGMRGIGKTVISGTQIEDFSVEVLGVMKNKGPVGDLILVRVSGDLIDRSGGIAEGMSGSPIYIDGKLAGAISYGWKLADHRVGMVTPIQDMLKMWDLPDSLNQPRKPSTDLIPLSTPLMASGFSERALTLLTEKLKPYNMVPLSVGDAPQGTDYGTLAPGSAVGVQLVRGDVTLGALGTVTYVEQDKVLAFGHPFLKKGNVNYLLANAYIYTAVDGLQTPFKVGSIDNLLGTVNQDRGAGIAGKIGFYPGIIPMLIHVKDTDINSERTAAVQIVQDEQLAPVLAENTVFNVVDKTIDRTGAGTAKISFSISGRDLPGDGVISRENMFFHPSNISASMTEEFFKALALLATNQFQKVDIMDIKVNVEVQNERRTAIITEVRADKSFAKPGEKIELTVKLKPYRGSTIKRKVAYKVPDRRKPGPLTLEVRGGGTVPLLQLLLKQQGLASLVGKKNKDKQKSLAQLIREFSEQDRNNDIVIEPYNPRLAKKDVGETEKTANKSRLSAKAVKDLIKQSKDAQETAFVGEARSTKDKTATPIDYIVEGEKQVIIQVLP